MEGRYQSQVDLRPGCSQFRLEAHSLDVRVPRFIRQVQLTVLMVPRSSLSNTQEMKPVTNSRDTQELPAEAGQEMLRIFLAHPSRTSLLQDFAFYEVGAGPCSNQRHPNDYPCVHSAPVASEDSRQQPTDGWSTTGGSSATPFSSAEHALSSGIPSSCHGR